MKLSSFISGLVLGGLGGFVVGMLSAPKPGSQLVQDIADTSDDLYRRAAFELEDLRDKVETLKNRADDLKETGREAIHNASRYVQSVIDSFEPEARNAIDHAQQTLTESTKTLEQSAETLHKVETPVVNAAIEEGGRDLSPQAAEELSQHFRPTTAESSEFQR